MHTQHSGPKVSYAGKYVRDRSLSFLSSGRLENVRCDVFSSVITLAIYIPYIYYPICATQPAHQAPSPQTNSSGTTIFSGQILLLSARVRPRGHEEYSGQPSRGHGSASKGCGRRLMRDGQRDDSRQGPAPCGRRYSPRAVPEEWWKNGSGVDGRSCVVVSVVVVGAKSSVDKSSVDRSGVDERSHGCCFALVGGCTEKAVFSARGRIGVRVPRRFTTRVPSRTTSLAQAPGPCPDDH